MHRRLLLTALACCCAGGLAAQDGGPLPRHRIAASQLHAALAARFPVRLGIPGLLQLQVSAPALHLLPARNKLGAGLLVELEGSQPRQLQAGEIDVAFALRYEAADRTVRARQLEILDLRWPGLPPETAQAIQVLLPRLARDAVGEFVLHRFTDRELALADTMGFEPASITVVDDGVVIGFGPKPRR